MSKISDAIGNRYYCGAYTPVSSSAGSEQVKIHTKTSKLVFNCPPVDETLKTLSKKQGEEVVEHPTHYNRGKYECIDVIDDLKLNFNLGSAFKYLWRCGFKDDEITELEKAKWYIEREIENRKKAKQ